MLLPVGSRIPAYNVSQRTITPERPGEHVLPGGPSVGTSINHSSRSPELAKIKGLFRIEPCETCASRRYQDKSDDSSVSFQSPTKVSPEQSAAQVMAHELEHVHNEQAKASMEGKEIVYQAVVLHSSICPECGKQYVAGGETKTVTKDRHQQDIQKGLFINALV